MTYLFLIVGTALVLLLGTLALIRFLRVRNPQGQANGSVDFATLEERSSPEHRWFNDRRNKLQSQFLELLAFKDRLVAATKWEPADEARLGRVRAEVLDYFSSIPQDLRANYQSYGQLFEQGPLTTVPFARGGWSMVWDVWMVDAHMALISIHAQTRLITLPDARAREWQQEFLTEIERCIEAAGLNSENPVFPRYKVENIVREITGQPLVGFDHSPSGRTIEQALNMLKVAPGLPDLGNFLPQRLDQASTRDFKEMMDKYKESCDGSWRSLTPDEKARVQARLNSSAPTAKSGDCGCDGSKQQA